MKKLLMAFCLLLTASTKPMLSNRLLQAARLTAQRRSVSFYQADREILQIMKTDLTKLSEKRINTIEKWKNQLSKKVTKTKHNKTVSALEQLPKWRIKDLKLKTAETAFSNQIKKAAGKKIKIKSFSPDNDQAFQAQMNKTIIPDTLTFASAVVAVGLTVKNIAETVYESATDFFF